MQIIPVIPAIKPDELLISYFFRIAAANGKTFDDDCYTDYFTNEWHGLGPTLINLAKQMDKTDPIDLFLDHTTFAYEQIVMTREQHKAIVNDIFSPDLQSESRPSRFLHNDFKYVKVCKDCAESGEFYIKRNHQLPSGFCTVHKKMMQDAITSNIFAAGTSLMEHQTVPSPDHLPTNLDLEMITIAEGIMDEYIVLTFEDAIRIVEKKFVPSIAFSNTTTLAIERADPLFFGRPYDEQCELLSDAFFAYEDHKETDAFPLRDCPNMTLGLLAESLRNLTTLKAELPISNSTYADLTISASRLGYRILTGSVKPLMKIMDTTNGLSKIVSVYSILDGEI